MRSVNKLMAPPKLVQYDNWGRRVDDLQTSEGWRRMKDLWQEEGLPGIFYERKHGEYSRIHGFAKIFIAVADSSSVGNFTQACQTRSSDTPPVRLIARSV